MTHPLRVDRRSALLGALALNLSRPLVGATNPGRRSAGSRESPGFEPEELRAAAALLQLDFDDEELAALAKELPRELGGLMDTARAAPFAPFGAAPATVFVPSRRAAHPFEQPGLSGHLAADSAAPSDPADLPWWPVWRLASALRARTLRSRQLTDLALERFARFDPRLKAVVQLLEKPARAAADRADAELDEGAWRGPLHGVPYALKDLFLAPESRTTFGAAPWSEGKAYEGGTSAVAERLARAGAVLVAKTTLGALAMGDRWYGGRTRNPWDPRRGSSGSSAGSAAAVAAGLVPFAIGTETLGSIVSPCVRCGTTGLRPSFGRISRAGAMPLSWTMDKVGPITRSVRDLSLVFDALHGADTADPSSREVPYRCDAQQPVRGLRVGLDEVLLRDGAGRDPALVRARDSLIAAGVELVPITGWPRVAGALRHIIGVEGAAVFDQPLRTGSLAGLVSQGRNAWPAIFRRARFVPAVEALALDRERRRVMDRYDRLFEEQRLAAILTPPFANSLLLGSNLSGHPQCVLPMERGRRGLRSTSLLGRVDGEGVLLRLALILEDAAQVGSRRPEGF